LIVDDESSLCEIFAAWLTNAGCPDVDTASNGEEALHLFSTRSFSLLISDLRMPKMDGVTLVRKLAVSGVQIPSIIFVSGFGDVDQREMYGLGVEAFLEKPLRRQQFVADVKAALSDRSELWVVPFDLDPEQKLGAPIERVDHVAAAGKCHLGRGGFSSPFTGSINIGRTSFDCFFPGFTLHVTGQGYVRWISKEEGSVGVEFAYLDEASRSWVLRELDVIHPTSFIPSL
jgi:CheY-like chemotaxis protein